MCVNAATPCAAVCSWKGDSVVWFLHLFNLSIDSTIKRKGTFCGLFLTPLLPSTAIREQPKPGILIDYSKWNRYLLPSLKGYTDLFKVNLAVFLHQTVVTLWVRCLLFTSNFFFWKGLVRCISNPNLGPKATAHCKLGVVCVYFSRV